MHSLGITWSIARYGAQQSYSSHVRTKTSWRVHKGENAVTVVELRFTTILPLKLDPGNASGYESSWQNVTPGQQSYEHADLADFGKEWLRNLPTVPGNKGCAVYIENTWYNANVHIRLSNILVPSWSASTGRTKIIAKTWSDNIQTWHE